MFSLIFAGEMIFSLPFHVARFFRPSLLESFSLTNTEIGDSFAVYGVTAMICYFPGGLIADHFSARKLLTFSLLATAVGGLYYAQIPQGYGLYLLFGYWGITSVLMFWSGMLKATRDWGGVDAQGRAFGLLDGGRGLAAALMSTIAVLIFSQFIELNSDSQSPSSTRSLQMVIYFYSFITALAAFLVWKNLPESKTDNISSNKTLDGVKQVITSKRIWLQAVIIVCAYSAYKGLDNYGLYAVQILSMDKIDAAAFTSLAAYLRPVGAILAGFVADKLNASKVIALNFLALVIIYSVLTNNWPESLLYLVALINLMVSFLAVFALRGIYFALVEESKVSNNVTGTAIGFVSLVGYTPDIFFASLTGRILDADVGIVGFQNYFLLLAVFAFIGMTASYALNRFNRVSVKKIIV